MTFVTTVKAEKTQLSVHHGNLSPIPFCRLVLCCQAYINDSPPWYRTELTKNRDSKIKMSTFDPHLGSDNRFVCSMARLAKHQCES